MDAPSGVCIGQALELATGCEVWDGNCEIEERKGGFSSPGVGGLVPGFDWILEGVVDAVG